MMIRTLCGLLGLGLCGSALFGQDIDSYLRELAERNNAYQAATFRWLAAQKEAEAAGTLPDPTLNLGLRATDIAQAGPQLQQLNFMQELPLAGKLGLERQQAIAMAAMARRERDVVAIEIVSRFKDIWADYYFAGQAAATTQEHLELLRDLEQVVTSSYQNGMAHYADLIGIQIERDTLENQLRTQQAALEPQAAALAVLLGRAPGEPFPLPQTLPLAPPPAALDDAALFRRLIDQNPTLAAFNEQKIADRFALQRIAKRAIPNLQVGLEWMNPLRTSSLGGSDDLMLMVGATLPIHRKRYQAETVAASARLEAGGQASEHQLAELRVAYRQACFERDDAERKLVLYRDQVLPKAEESFKVIASAFKNGERSYLDLIEAERALLAFRLSSHEAMANGYKAQTKLEAILGLNPLADKED